MPERALGDWLHHLEQIHPREIDLGLGRTADVARVLGLLPYTPRVVTIAGTNGKGTVAYTCDALLRSAGSRTGRYTSPHLLRYNERICLDGEPVSDAEIVAAFEAIEAARGSTTLTYFEFSTLAALWIFKRHAVDVAILEVGLGGRLDAVNIVDCDVAVITAIDLDHQHWLGDTVEAIAVEKAAVARPGKPVVLAEAGYPDSLAPALDAIGATIVRAGDQWSWQASTDEVSMTLAGRRGPWRLPVPHGLRPGNIAAAVQACHCLAVADLDQEAAARALDALSVPGRRQSLEQDDRTVVFDVAHNPAAMAALVEFLKINAVDGRTVAALGLMADKDLPSMAAMLADVVDGAWAVALPGIERAQDPEIIWESLDRAGIAAAQREFTAESVWSDLWSTTSAGDRIVVCGSFHTVAGIMATVADSSSGF